MKKEKPVEKKAAEKPKELLVSSAASKEAKEISEL